MKRGFEAPWWAFLAGIIIAIVVVVFVLILTGRIKIGAESQIANIGGKFGDLFK